MSHDFFLLCLIVLMMGARVQIQGAEDLGDSRGRWGEVPKSKSLPRGAQRGTGEM